MEFTRETQDRNIVSEPLDKMRMVVVIERTKNSGGLDGRFRRK